MRQEIQELFDKVKSDMSQWTITQYGGIDWVHPKQLSRPSFDKMGLNLRSGYVAFSLDECMTAYQIAQSIRSGAIEPISESCKNELKEFLKTI